MTQFQIGLFEESYVLVWQVHKSYQEINKIVSVDESGIAMWLNKQKKRSDGIV